MGFSEQSDANLGTRAAGSYLQPASVCFDDPFRNRHAKAGAFRLGREIRLENKMPLLRRQASAVVLHCHADRRPALQVVFAQRMVIYRRSIIIPSSVLAGTAGPMGEVSAVPQTSRAVCTPPGEKLPMHQAKGS
jgi:hypothetical protein